MEPSQEFAQALLDQLRRDLKRFAPGQISRLNRILGRSPRYFQRLTADRLKLQDALVAIRFLRFEPLEFVERVVGQSRDIPSGLAGYFTKRRPSTVDQSGLAGNLEQLKSWISDVLVDTSAPVYDLNVRGILHQLGLRAHSEDTIDAGRALLSICERHRPQCLHPQTAASFCSSLHQLAKALMDEGHLGASCEALDAAFRLEQSLRNPALRKDLFASSAALSRKLGYLMESPWLLREAAELSLWSPEADFQEAVDLYRSSLEARVHENSLSSIPPREKGARSAINTLKALEMDRRAFGIEQLDARLGAVRAYSVAVRNVAPITVRRWHQLLTLLGQHPASVLRKIHSPEYAANRPMGGFFQSLLHRNIEAEPTLFEFQKSILSWAHRVDISDEEPCLELLDRPDLLGHPLDAFQGIVTLFAGQAHTFPGRIHSSDAVTLSQFLLRLVYVTRRQWQLKAAANLLDATFHLLDLVPDRKARALAYRSAFRMTLDVGFPEYARMMLDRAKWLDLEAGNPHGLAMTIKGLGDLAHLRADYHSTIELKKVALKIMPGSTPAFIHQDLAEAYSQLGELDQATRHLALASPQRQDDPLALASYLSVEGYISSLKGNEADANQCFSKALDLLKETGHVRDLLLIRIRFYEHLVRFNKNRSAEEQAMNLLGAIHGMNAPIPVREAVNSLARDHFGGTSRHHRAMVAMRTLQHPFLILS